MDKIEKNKVIKSFVSKWSSKGDEKSDTQSFWFDLLHDILEINNPTDIITFEKRVLNAKTTNFIDGYIRITNVLIEQKSININLDKAEINSNGFKFTPYEQAENYSNLLPLSEKPKWIIISNFKEIRIHNMNESYSNRKNNYYKIVLEDLLKEYDKLNFIVDSSAKIPRKEEKISIKAGELVGKLYDELLKQFGQTLSSDDYRNLNILCVRIVFCLFAEDAGLFQSKNAFHDFISKFNIPSLYTYANVALENLFDVLNTRVEDRKITNKELLSFPYINGDLFREKIKIPELNHSILNHIIFEASENFDWSLISPTIFGAVFESTLNPEARRSGGMHYTSTENIHRVIDPLFLNSLKDELSTIITTNYSQRTLERDLYKFQDKLSKIIILDPACGSGNFLTESYLSLRRLENEVIRILQKDGLRLAFSKEFSPIKVSLNQFFGIEINDFAVAVSKTSLWISECQTLQETEDILSMSLSFLPLKSNSNIDEGNALEINWESIVSSTKLTYIIGNPPFIGARLTSSSQKKDILSTFGDKWPNYGNLDYVSAWFKKAADFIRNTKILCAFVSTSSIVQGENVVNLWKPLFSDNIVFRFAYKPFLWDSEANSKARVYVVIIGFSSGDDKSPKFIYTNKNIKNVSYINPYLSEGNNVFVENRLKPLSNVKELVFGSMPNDGGYLSNITTEDMNETINKFPDSKTCFKRILGAKEFIDKKERYCLWLKNTSPDLINKIPFIRNRVLSVKEHRLKSSRNATKQLGNKPYLFGEIRQPEAGSYLLIPSTTSENRTYVPIDFLDSSIISTNANLILPNASLFDFGILTSSIHFIWMRAVCGRLENRYRYSINIVYNNFVWPKIKNEYLKLIEETSKQIIAVRELYKGVSFADLYNDDSMPLALKVAHKNNDNAVLRAYGLNNNLSESEILDFLFNLYSIECDK
jgi:hypothetical protein